MVRTRGNNKKGKYGRKTRKTNNRGRTRKTNISRKNNRRKNNRRNNNRRTNNRRTNNRRKNTKLQNTSILGGADGTTPDGITPDRLTAAQRAQSKRNQRERAAAAKATREMNRAAIAAAAPNTDVHGPSGIRVDSQGSSVRAHASGDVKGAPHLEGAREGWQPGVGAEGVFKASQRADANAASLGAAASVRSPVSENAKGATFNKLRTDALKTLDASAKTAAATKYTTLGPAQVGHLAKGSEGYHSQVNTGYAGAHPSTERGGLE